MWIYYKSTRCLKLNSFPYYEIDLDRCASSAQVLDWISQVSKKTWATSELIGDLVLKLDEVLNLQRNICGWGVDHKLDVRQWLYDSQSKEVNKISTWRFKDANSASASQQY
jgi:hypothetical protein